MFRTTRAPLARILLLAGLLLTSVPANADHPMQVPFKETLTVVSFDPETGVFTYEGQATHLGNVTAVSDPDGSFIMAATSVEKEKGEKEKRGYTRSVIP